MILGVEYFSNKYKFFFFSFQWKGASMGINYFYVIDLSKLIIYQLLTKWTQDNLAVFQREWWFTQNCIFPGFQDISYSLLFFLLHWTCTWSWQSKRLAFRLYKVNYLVFRPTLICFKGTCVYVKGTLVTLMGGNKKGKQNASFPYKFSWKWPENQEFNFEGHYL